MKDLLGDIRQGGRMITRNPGFYTFSIGTMVVGIACLTAVFSVVHGVLLEPLPYPDPEEIVSIQSIHPEYGNNLLSRVEVFDAFRQESRTTSNLAAVQAANLQMTTPEGPEQLRVLLSTPSLFDLLGTAAELGRLFEPDEGRYGRERVAVLSYELWRRSFGGDPVTLGRSLSFVGDPVLGGIPGQEESVTIVGVLPRGFKGPFGSFVPDLWLADSFDKERVSTATHVMAFGRLREGVGRDAAQQELGAIYGRLQLATGGESKWRTRLVPLRDFLVGSLRRPLELLFVGGLIVLFVACANTANLLLAKAEMRASEVAVRRAMGAAQPRLVRQLAAESLVPAFLAGALGLAVAWLLLRLFGALGAGILPRRFDFGIDPTVVAVVVALTLATNLLFALVPALRFSRLRLRNMIEGNSSGGSRRIGKVRFALVAFQVALAVVVGVSSILLVESVQGLRAIDPGFTREQVLTGWISLPEPYYPEGHQRRNFYQRLLGGVRSLPGVEQAGLINFLPFSGRSGATEITVESPGPQVGPEPVQIQFRAVSQGYFDAMQIPCVEGRYFDLRDLTRPAVIVSEKAARMLWGDRDALGQRVKLGGRESRNSWSEVVGVVSDIRHDSLTRESQPTLYVPFISPNRMALVVRTVQEDPERLAPAVHRVLEEVDPKQPLHDVRTLSARVEAGLGGVRLGAWLMSLLGAVTLFLAAVGVYGATYEAVVERHREIGIRYAMGATGRDISSLVFGKLLPWLGAGLACGVLGSLLLGRYLASLLYGVEPTNPLVLSLAFGFVALVALLGTYLPTKKATRVDPCVILKV